MKKYIHYNIIQMTNDKEFKQLFLCNIYRMDQRQYTSQHLKCLPRSLIMKTVN